MDDEHYNDLDLPPLTPMTGEEKAELLYSYIIALLGSQRRADFRVERNNPAVSDALSDSSGPAKAGPRQLL